MRSYELLKSIGCIAASVVFGGVGGCAHAQNLGSAKGEVASVRLAGAPDTVDRERPAPKARPVTADLARAPRSPRRYQFKSRVDSLSWARNRTLAARSTGFRLVVSLQDRRVWAIIGQDTVLDAPAAVAKGTTLDYEGHEYKFDTPRGVRRVLRKESDPVWLPPDWLYVETAAEHGLNVKRLTLGHPNKLEDGRSLTVRDSMVGVLDHGEFAVLPTDEHIVFDNTLFIPPMGTKNRRIYGELGRFRLDLGEGYLLHGTPYKESIGMAATHGCVRLRDEDIEWLYDHVPVGTRVYIY